MEPFVGSQQFVERLPPRQRKILPMGKQPTGIAAGPNGAQCGCGNQGAGRGRIGAQKAASHVFEANRQASLVLIDCNVALIKRNSSGTGVDFAGQNPPNDLT